jgi:hypothetical protein
VRVPSAPGAPCSVDSQLRVLCVSSPGVVHVRVLPLTDGSSPESHVRSLEEVLVVSHCPVAGFSSPS